MAGFFESQHLLNRPGGILPANPVAAVRVVGVIILAPGIEEPVLALRVLLVSGVVMDATLLIFEARVGRPQ